MTGTTVWLVTSKTSQFPLATATGVAGCPTVTEVCPRDCSTSDSVKLQPS